MLANHFQIKAVIYIGMHVSAKQADIFSIPILSPLIGKNNNIIEVFYEISNTVLRMLICLSICMSFFIPSGSRLESS